MKIKPYLTSLSRVSCAVLIGASLGHHSANAQAVKEKPVDPALLKQAHVLYSPDNKLPAGSIFTSVDTMDMKNSKLVLVMGGQNIEGTTAMNGLKKNITTITGVDSVEVKYVEDKMQQKMTVNGQQQNQPARIGKLVGKTITYKKQDGKWSGKFKGDAETTKEQNEQLARRTKNRNNPEELHILGTQPRKVGDTWDVDVSKLTSFGGGDVPPKGTFKITFKTIKNYQGHACAVLEADVDLTGKDKEGMTMNIKRKNTVYHSLKYMLTLQNKLDGSMTVSGAIQGGAGNVKVEGAAAFLDRTELKLP